MAMHIIDRDYLYSENNMPDFSGWEDEELESMCSEIYRSRVYDALDARGLTWFPETSEIGAEGGTDMASFEISELFESVTSEVWNDLVKMGEDEIRAAYAAM